MINILLWPLYEVYIKKNNTLKFLKDTIIFFNTYLKKYI